MSFFFFAIMCMSALFSLKMVLFGVASLLSYYVLSLYCWKCQLKDEKPSIQMHFIVFFFPYLVLSRDCFAFAFALFVH